MMSDWDARREDATWNRAGAGGFHGRSRIHARGWKDAARRDASRGIITVMKAGNESGRTRGESMEDEDNMGGREGGREGGRSVVCNRIPFKNTVT